MEERELPAGWASYCLADIGGTKGGKTPSKSRADFWEPQEIHWTSPKDMKTFDLLGSEDKISRRAVTDGGMEILPSKSVLMVTRSGILSHSFPVAIAWIETTINQDIKAVKPVQGIDERFVAYTLRSLERSILASCSKEGTTVASVETKLLERLPLPLAPLNEQRRISAKLDTTLAAVDACRQRLEGVADLLKRFRQAVLEAATTGALTREWRQERNIRDHGWEARTIAEIASQVFDGPFGSHLKSADYVEEGFRVVRLENLSHLNFLEENRTYISAEKFASLQKHALLEDDILFSSFIDEEVRTCLLPSELSGVSINKADCFCIRINRDIALPALVVGALSCRSTFESLDSLIHGATRPRINLKQLREISIQIPSLEEQHEIVRRAQALFSLADQLEAKLNSARQVVERLTPALLAKAFRGELVSQDPSDEPASVLLERIRAARQAEAAAGKPSRRGRKQAAANPAPGVCDAALGPPDLLVGLLRECGALSERALLAASELAPERFQRQLAREMETGRIREDLEEGERVLVLVG